jgi:hypothetical protein
MTGNEKISIPILIVLAAMSLNACTGAESTASKFNPVSAAGNPTEDITGLFISTTKQGSLDTTNDPTIVRSRFVEINFDLLANEDGTPKEDLSSGDVLKLNLFEDITLNAVFDRVETVSEGSFSWIGNLEGFDHSEVILVVRDGILTGNISLTGVNYQVRFAGEGIHAVHQIDQSAFPPEAEPVPETNP